MRACVPLGLTLRLPPLPLLLSVTLYVQVSDHSCRVAVHIVSLVLVLRELFK